MRTIKPISQVPIGARVRIDGPHQVPMLAAVESRNENGSLGVRWLSGRHGSPTGIIDALIHPEVWIVEEPVRVSCGGVLSVNGQPCRVEPSPVGGFTLEFTDAPADAEIAPLVGAAALVIVEHEGKAETLQFLAAGRAGQRGGTAGFLVTPYA